MNSDQPLEKPENVEKGGRNLRMMVLASLVFSLVLLGVGLWLYHANGTYLLDLSRPGYQPESDSASTQNEWSFSSSGQLKTEDFEGFNQHFSDKLNRIKAIDAFSDEALSDESLGL